MDVKDKLFLQKVSQFIKIAINKIDTLEDALLDYRKKEAAEKIAEDRYDDSIKKAADALYESDFITDEYERRQFIKRAKEDPAHLARTLEKVCNAADVALVGTPARVASRKKEAEYDPVMARAFGMNYSGNSIIDE